MAIGAWLQTDGSCVFRVWAPSAQRVEICLTDRRVPMTREASGYWQAHLPDCPAGTAYRYCLDGKDERPDPASFAQPDGVHGPSRVTAHAAFSWTDQTWSGVPLDQMVIYELHVGTFTPEGTFAAVKERLAELKDLGITALEIMPVSPFPGGRNWGYDGVYPFAVQDSYGGPDGLKDLVDACHRAGLAVILDVVYNHLGPEGNYLGGYGPYFTDKYHTPWGQAVNFDDTGCEGVRKYFIANALYWLEHFHVDALRLDAVHGIFDNSPRHILAEMADTVQAFARRDGRPRYLIAESDLNDERLVREKKRGGYGLDAQWCDDFHHALHTVLTGEQDGYYGDFGALDQLAAAYREGFVYTGQYSSFRQRPFGTSSRDIPAGRLVVCAQNHDQIGNRMMGDRLSTLVSFEAQKLAAAAVLFSPFVPLLFMGEEYGETRPFLYFISHLDPGLIQAVREGRKKEFSAFLWKGEPPDPYSEETFCRSTLDWAARNDGRHGSLRRFYKTAFTLRRTLSALTVLDKERMTVTVQGRLLGLERPGTDDRMLIVMNFSAVEAVWQDVSPAVETQRMLDSADVVWEGPGTLVSDIISGPQIRLRPWSCVVLRKRGMHV